MMKKINGDYPSCANCQYADKYIPYFTYRFADPYCSKNHGKCSTDKLCEDYRLIGSHYCCECTYFKNDYCCKDKKQVKDNQLSCVYFKIKMEEI